MNRVFGYLRVSGKNQIGGDGFDRQRQTISDYCAAKNLVVVRWFEEKAISGDVEHGDRPAFSEMLSLMGPGTGVESIIVERTDRLARDLMVSELLIDEVRKAGMRIFEAAGDLDLTNSDDPTRVMVRQMMGVLAQWEKNNLVKKLRAARERKSRELGRCCSARLPWEQRTPEGREAGRIIFEMRERGARFQEIANWLNQQKIPTPDGSRYWFKSSVHDIYGRISIRFHRGVEPILHDVADSMPQSQVQS